MYNKEPWEDEQRPFSAMTEKSVEETIGFIAASAASKKLDAFLADAIDKTKQESDMSANKLVEFVDMVEGGLKSLEAEIDDLMPRFQKAMEKGKENMPKMHAHVQRIEAAVEKVEDFNRRMEGSNQ